MSLSPPLKSQLFSEADCPPKGQKIRPPRGMGARVFAWLWGEFPNTHQPKTIAREARTPYEGTKKWLARNNGGHVIDAGNGWYRARATVHLLKRLGFSPIQVHGLQVMLKSRVGGSPPRLQGHVSLRADGVGKGDWRGRLLTVQVTPTGCLVSIRASMQPFGVPEFVELAAFLEGCANGGSVTVENIEFNTDCDADVVRIAGAQALSIQGVRDAAVKAYNKEAMGVLRFEGQFRRLDAPMAEIVKVLNEIATPPEAYRADLAPPDSFGEVA